MPLCPYVPIAPTEAPKKPPKAPEKPKTDGGSYHIYVLVPVQKEFEQLCYAVSLKCFSS